MADADRIGEDLDLLTDAAAGGDQAVEVLVAFAEQDLVVFVVRPAQDPEAGSAKP